MHFQTIYMTECIFPHVAVTTVPLDQWQRTVWMMDYEAAAWISNKRPALTPVHP